jgi:hypothetical protein
MIKNANMNNISFILWRKMLARWFVSVYLNRFITVNYSGDVLLIP